MSYARKGSVKLTGFRVLLQVDVFPLQEQTGRPAASQDLPGQYVLVGEYQLVVQH